MARIVIVAYKPKPGRERDLETLMDTHHSTLKSERMLESSALFSEFAPVN